MTVALASFLAHAHGKKSIGGDVCVTVMHLDGTATHIPCNRRLSSSSSTITRTTLRRRMRTFALEAKATSCVGQRSHFQLAQMRSSSCHTLVLLQKDDRRLLLLFFLSSFPFLPSPRRSSPFLCFLFLSLSLSFFLSFLISPVQLYLAPHFLSVSFFVLKTKERKNKRNYSRCLVQCLFSVSSHRDYLTA